MARRPCFATLALAALPACTSLDRFDTDGGAAYCGSMVGSPAFHEGILPEGVPPTLRLAMTLDVDALRERTSRAFGSSESGAQSETRTANTVVVGRFTTDDASDGLCATAGTVLFDNAPLRAIPELDHDPLFNPRVRRRARLQLLRLGRLDLSGDDAVAGLVDAQ